MKNKSFTLIELLVVIVIIGILAGVIIVSVSSSINKANFAKAQSFSNAVQNELLGDLVSEWTFDIASNPGEDTWGNNDGTVSGATYKPKADEVCVYGGCYEFDGDDYVQIADSQEMRMTQGGTISAWIYPKSGGYYGRIVDKTTNTGGANGYMFYIESSNRLNLIINNITNTISSNNAITFNQWQFVVATFDSSGRKIYVNGVNVAGSGATETEIPPNVAGVVAIGNRAGATDRTFDGLIDDVRIYKAVLSSSQIKQQYVAGLDLLLSKNLISLEEYNTKINSLASN